MTSARATIGKPGGESKNGRNPPRNTDTPTVASPKDENATEKARP